MCPFNLGTGSRAPIGADFLLPRYFIQCDAFQHDVSRNVRISAPTAPSATATTNPIAISALRLHATLHIACEQSIHLARFSGWRTPISFMS
ncbi:hypothetical protein BGV52_04855 [Burkholderia ubonensis]|nr:hypothetical protein WK73_24645 [Burkholderia ubonensis]OJB11888.1 hypothetical protein BGV52_04855 [Burkholderia ubonensis]OJB70223.1 hypothetical protein BGV61_02390 [Burkholderia ubonensis]